MKNLNQCEITYQIKKFNFGYQESQMNIVQI